MANADRCYLNIPFKNYLKSLADSITPDGTLDPEILQLAAEREFENCKAIERRINDSTCGGDCACQHSMRLTEAELNVGIGATDEIAFDGTLAVQPLGNPQFWATVGWTFGVSGAIDWRFNVPVDGFYHVTCELLFNYATTPITVGQVIYASIQTGAGILQSFDKYQFYSAEEEQQYTPLHMEADLYLTTTDDVFISCTNGTSLVAPLAGGFIQAHGFCVCGPATFASA